MLLWLYRLVEKYGEGQWSLISTFFPGRIGKQCRERWHHQLNPKINRNAWSVEEERIIVAAHKVCAGIPSHACYVSIFGFFSSYTVLCFLLNTWLARAYNCIGLLVIASLLVAVDNFSLDRGTAIYNTQSETMWHPL